MLQVGIVGLPNVGKSSLFNLLTAAGVASDNYPFCTVEPNVGPVAVPDPRLERVQTLTGSRERVPTSVQFVDIAGLVEGASRGEGLGNQFLGQIREVDALAHVLRFFDDADVTHVDGSVDPRRDAEVVDTELALADLATVARRKDKIEKKARSGEGDARKELEILDRLHQALETGKPLRDLGLSGPDRALARELSLLTAKPMMFVANMGDEVVDQDFSGGPHSVLEALNPHAAPPVVVPVSLKLEAELALLEAHEREDFLVELGIGVAGTPRIIRAAFELLDLITFFSSNEKQTTAWAVRRGTRAPEAAGVIHTDFQRGFIRAEAVGFEDLSRAGGMKEARDAGLVRSEGKEYVVADGDVLLFRFNV